MLFPTLLQTLDHAHRPQDKTRALTHYFQTAPHADAAWALHLFTGKRSHLKRLITPAQIREWSARAANIPDWLAEESFTAVGDNAEAAALILPESTSSAENPLQNLTLKELIEDHLLALSRLDTHSLEERVTHIWKLTRVPQRLLFNRLLLGGAGLKLSNLLVLKALADAFGVSHAQIATRLTVDWLPTPDAFARLITKDATVQTLGDAGLPYPFQSAQRATFHWPQSPETEPPTPLLRSEWLYDGLRVQLIKRRGRWLLWTHTGHKANQPVTGSFPEFALGALALPDGTVIDAVVAAWGEGRPQHIAGLLPRLEIKNREISLWETAPNQVHAGELTAMLIAIDLLEHQGQDIRRLPLLERLGLLAPLVTPLTREHPFRLADAWPADSWEACDRARRQARAMGCLGVILKPLLAPYLDPPSPWLVLPADPLIVDCVLTAVQPAPSGRAGQQYVLSVWSGAQLVTVARADSALSHDDQKQIDRFIRENTTARHGPLRTVHPQLVVQVSFDSAHAAPRHKSGLTLINPTVLSIKPTTSPDRAATLPALRQIARI